MESYDKRVYSVNGYFQSALKYQMSAVAAMILARKVRVSITDQPGLVLQSLGQLNEKSNPGQLQLVHNSNVRRFSIVEKQSEESLSNCEVFSKFSSSVFQPALTLPSPGEPSTDISSSSYNSTDILADTTESGCVLTRVRSSPHLSVLPSLLASQQKNSNEGSALTSQYMQCENSHSDLLEASDGSDNTVNKAIMPSAVPTSDGRTYIESSQSGTNSIGFGILSRTRQFGAWLTKATEGSKVEITKQDLNVLAPNSF